MITNQLKVLLAVDRQVDPEVYLNALRTEFTVVADICSSADEFARLIDANNYDVLLAEYNLHEWTGMQAIDVARRLGKNTPLIIVTGHLGEERAVNCIRQGAADYVLTNRLDHLPSAVRRAIEENKARAQCHLLAAAVCSVREGVLIAEAAPKLANSRIVSLNESFALITGRPASDLIGQTLACFKTDDSQPEFFASYTPGAPSPDPFVIETMHRRFNGQEYDAEWQISPIRDSSQRITHYVVLHRDITDRKRAAAELALTNSELVRYSEQLKDAKYHAELATRAKSDFLAAASHEIRTPMNVIIGMADLLSDTELTVQQAKYVEVFQRAGENLLVLINQLLDHSKIESGKFDLEDSEFDLKAVLAKTINLFEVPAEHKGLALSYHLDPNTPVHLVGDSYRLQQILTNLIGNAVKFTDRGSISVEARLMKVLSPSECSIQFKVVDSGKGIPEDKKATIFEPFAQAHSSISRQYGGTGLGLAISRALVERMNGTMTVESTVGVGSVFSFTATCRLASSNAMSGSEVAPKRILLCEDSQDNAFVVRAYLTGSNYEIEHVVDGNLGVDRFKDGIFDAVLMDMQMPVLDGHAATQRIRQWESDHQRIPTPILALTAHAQVEEAKRCEACGCTAFLSKPIRKATLLEALDKYVAQSTLLRENSSVPPEVQELVPGYLKQKRVEVDRIWTAIEKADYPTIATLGHQLKASGASYGFDGLSAIGTALETSAKTHDIASMKRHAELFDRAIAGALANGFEETATNGCS